MSLVLTVVIAGLALLPGHFRPPAAWLARTAGFNRPAAEFSQPVAIDLPPLPAKISTETLALGAASAYAIDAPTSQVLFDQNSGTPRPIASITKLITALVIVKNHELAEVVTVPPLPPYAPGDELVGLVAGQKFTIGDLLKATLIQSGNDAADALAIIDSGSTAGFAVKMNQLATDWGIALAHFTSASGLVENDNFASAQSLAKLGQLALTNHFIGETVAMPAANITAIGGPTYQLRTINQLLADKRFRGIKTGYTDAAGQSLIGLADVNGHPVITVVLASPDRFAETLRLVNWLQRVYQWR